jgi:two-component system cell cycle response regulator
MTTVLLVDDEASIRSLLRRTLEQAGYRTMEAGGGREALRMAGEARPDLVLLDVALPDMSGLEVCRRLAQAAPTARTPVLLLTGLAKPEHSSCGARGIVTKPFAPDALLERVAEALQAA